MSLCRRISSCSITSLDCWTSYPSSATLMIQGFRPYCSVFQRISWQLSSEFPGQRTANFLDKGQPMCPNIQLSHHIIHCLPSKIIYCSFTVQSWNRLSLCLYCMFMWWAGQKSNEFNCLPVCTMVRQPMAKKNSNHDCLGTESQTTKHAQCKCNIIQC